MIIMATRLRTTGPGDWFCCGGRFAVSAVFFCPRFLIDFGNDSNHRQKRGFVTASFFLSPEADLKFLIHQSRNSKLITPKPGDRQHHRQQQKGYQGTNTAGRTFRQLDLHPFFPGIKSVDATSGNDIDGAKNKHDKNQYCQQRRAGQQIKLINILPLSSGNIHNSANIPR